MMSLHHLSTDNNITEQTAIIAEFLLQFWDIIVLICGDNFV
jgi:hypothetical protein